MKFRLAFRCTCLLALIAFAGCGGGSNSVARLKKNMVQIPGKDYLICKYEVTQALWEYVMGENPSESWGMGPDYPVDNVSWDDCQVFLEKLNALPEVKASGYAYRIPTADEWKFACLAGATGDHSSFYPSLYCKLANGEEITRKTLTKVAWYHDNSAIKGMMHKHPVGKKSPNAFGLYDMHGNVKEWTSTTDSRGYQLIFGGDFYSNAADCMADNGHSLDPYYHPYNTSFSGVGLRLVTDKSGKAASESAIKTNGDVAVETPDKEKAVLEKLSKSMVAKLAADMVSIPGKKYYVSRFEVTQALWDAVMGDNPSKTKGGDLPVEDVSMGDCLTFIKKLNADPRIGKTDFVFRLPTKDEWNFACRAGAEDYYCKLADGTEIEENTLGKVAWYAGNSDNRTHPVGQKAPNAFGLYDMLGNVWEYAAAGEKRFALGGACQLEALECNSSSGYSKTVENGLEPAFGIGKTGFRLAADTRSELSRKNERKKKLREKLPEMISQLKQDMVPIPGTFVMLCRYEVTQVLWEAIMGEPPSDHAGDDLPVDNVSLVDCMQFLEKLNDMDELKDGQFTFFIPAAELWEKACLWGASGEYSKLMDGAEITAETLGEVAWIAANSGGNVHPVGQKKPNALGLYDMLGNANEWTVTKGEAAIDGEGYLACGGNIESENCTARHNVVLPPSLPCAGLRLGCFSVAGAWSTTLVTIPGKDFFISKFEVTQPLWQYVMGDNPSQFKDDNPECPVEKVSWNDCQKFLEKLNALPEVKASGITYRLPTAEEWCYACLAGGEEGYCKLADGTEITKDTIGEVANCIHNLWRGGTPSPVTPDSTNPVGRKKPNAFGLYDVHGNVSEWTSTAYQGGRLALGGSWNHLAYGCMVIPMISALGSDKKAPDYKDNTIGLRLVADKSEEAEEGSAGEAEMRKEPENTNSIKTDANAGKTYLKEGLKYRDGDGVEKDVAKAMSLLRKAAELGEANAYFYLGSFYYEGNGVEKNMAMVADLWRKGAEIEKAQNRQTIIRWMLSTCLLQQGGAENETEAVKWLEQASELVNVDNIDDVRFLLAVCYLQGKGLPPGASRRQYEAKGRQLLAIAALRGHKDAAKALESLDEP